jgi:hypothetical protein
MCYVCRKPIKGYDHFGPGKCAQSDDTNKRNTDDLINAGKEELARLGEAARNQLEKVGAGKLVDASSFKT